MVDAADDLDLAPSLEPPAQGPVADEGKRAAVEPPEGIGEPHDVLPLGQPTEAEEGRLPLRRGAYPEALEVDA